ncbi:hypothetical protein N7E81_10565 [Reichenbachiella carrageenanivorans]|uniref:PH domain-containing protein n=1 Tax=Reichenbachiella carrageenanivorans TaxID=2979869 RepID=A0ABY6CVA4_9BACT|nr:hypothetical protein [Reichenbachiella carrageenanivorans]UXX77813.1 hypothetical protein N7E81_10565 [Reichenbachiella carrageenanivorans]
MIVSKPKIGTLFSVGLFITIAFAAFIYGLTQIQSATDRSWWYLLVYTSGPIGFVVLVKILFSIKTVKVSKEKFEVKFPFKLSRYAFGGKEIDHWFHTSIKTYGGLYEELTIKLTSGKQLALSKQENTEYDKMLNYMKKKFKRLQK